MTAAAKLNLVNQLYREELVKLTPSMGRLVNGSPMYSGQQVAYAKGRAWKRALAIVDAQAVAA